ncbi:hypothetical protein QZH41_008028 [Actinostola sp. cb2023]|nr:hypothetical protein QZH41_008028 [Actinostola sp. cb2023]
MIRSAKEIKFKVDLDRRAVRERYNLLATELRRKLKNEEKASGIDTEMTEVEDAIEELISQDESHAQHKESMEGNIKKKIDREQAEEMRTQALEKLGESQKRKFEDSDMKPEGKRSSNGGEAVQFLKERNEMMTAIRKEELEVQVKAQEVESQRHHEFLQIMWTNKLVWYIKCSCKTWQVSFLYSKFGFAF